MDNVYASVRGSLLALCSADGTTFALAMKMKPASEAEWTNIKRNRSKTSFSFIAFLFCAA